MSLIPTGFAKSAAAGGFYSHTIDQSLRFNDNDSAYLSRTPASAGNRKTWTWSGWVKRGNMPSNDILFMSNNASSPYNTTGIEFNNNVFRFTGYYDSGVGSYRLDSAAVYRDTSAWYHLVCVYNSTHATSTERLRMYVNGERITAFSTETYPPQNQDSYINFQNPMYLGWNQFTEYFDGYLAEVHFIDGTALDATSFGEFKSGVWIPKAYEGSYGTNGFYLDFDGTYYNDKSGNGNNWTANNLAATDVVLDSPTNNFATWNAAWASHDTLSEGNLKTAGNSNWNGVQSTFAASSGKWYWEELVLADNADYNIGIQDTSVTASGDQNSAQGTSVIEVYNYSSGSCRIRHEGSYSTISGSSYAASGDVMGFALDMDSSTFKYYRNGTLYHTQSLDSSFANVAPYSAKYHASASHTNFGQDSSFAGNKTAQGNTDDNGIGDFFYPVPSGFLSLCSANLPDPVESIDPAQDGSPQDHFNTVLYTGTGSPQSITGVGFQPDLVWIKRRNGNGSHRITDSVRGAGQTLMSDDTGAEYTGNDCSAFNADGFTNGGNSDDLNDSYVAWNWKAGTSYTPTVTGAFSNPSASINVDAGFGIYKVTGSNNISSFTHGLGTTPDLFIAKNLDNTYDWAVWSRAENSYNDILHLNNTDAKVTKSGIIQTLDDTEIEVNSYAETASNGDYIYYVFSNRDGFSKFGSYTGNGSSDGSFIYTGFRPAFVMIKRTDSGSDWWIHDTKRNTYNLAASVLRPNDSVAETTDTTNVGIDINSNGFKLRNSYAGFNASGSTYIYMCFSENPFKYSNAR